MARGYSLHIGLNSVNPARYDGWSGDLMACEADAFDMRAIARRMRFSSVQTVLTRRATYNIIRGVLIRLATKLVPGDLLFLSYSGHGAQVPDGNSDEPDKQDETWVLYDRMMVDDELYNLLARFKSGVRIFVLSDSCHSGTVIRGYFTPTQTPALRSESSTEAEPRYRLMPLDVNLRIYSAHKEFYDNLQKINLPSSYPEIKASAILISGCQDNQYSLDGATNGLFTGTLKQIWNTGQFAGNYRRLRDEIARIMPPSQTPNYYTTGVPSPEFEAQTPFKW